MEKHMAVDMVLKYIKKQDTSILEFKDVRLTYNGEAIQVEIINNIVLPAQSIKLLESKKLILAINEILSLSQKYASVIKDTKEVSCTGGRRRSSLDIWRHLFFFRDDISILDVMSSLYEYKDSSHVPYRRYCPTIMKRVFRFPFDREFRYGDKELDEYQLLFADWNEINKD